MTRNALASLFGADNSITFVGDAAALNELRGVLLETSHDRLDLTPVVTPPKNYVGAATSIRVSSDGHSGLEVVRDAAGVAIVGDLAARALLAENISKLAAAQPGLGGHLHIDYFPDHPYVRSTSAPVIVMLEQ